MKDLSHPLMTLRVSRDSGQTFGEPVVVHLVDKDRPPVNPLVWPPCQCPIHRTEGS